MSVNTYSQVLRISNVTNMFLTFRRRPFRTHVHPPLATLYVPLFSRVAHPHDAPTVDLIKTRLQQGDAPLKTKSAFPVLMKTTLNFLSVQSSRCRSLHHTVDRLFLRGTRSLARHVCIVNPVHSYIRLFFLLADW